MIITAGIAGIGLTLAAYRYTNREEIIKKKIYKCEEQEFKNKWNLTMKYNGIKNKNEQTFTVLKYIPKQYGNDAIISMPLGLGYDDFYKVIPSLKTTFGGIVIGEPSSDFKTAYIRVASDISQAPPKDIVRFKWYTIMASNDRLHNHNHETFRITKITEKDEYGFDIEITIPDGLSYPMLEAIQTTVENNFKGKIYQDYIHFDNKVNMTIVTKELPDDKKFEPIELGVEELLLGMTYNYIPATVDLKILSHMSYTGTTNTGKTICLLTSLTNHIYWHDETKWDLFLSMISSKKDLKIFANVKQCKYFADNLDKALLMFKHIKRILDDRNRQFDSDDDIINIYDWNKKYPNRKMKPIIIATDEAASYMPSSLNNQEIGNKKQQCLDIMLELYREGRSCGIHLLSSLQRPDINSFPPTMKALIGAKVVFYMPNGASSKTALDDTSATSLRKQREAILDGVDRVVMKTLYLTPEMIKHYISHRIDPNHKHLNLDGKSNDKPIDGAPDESINDDKKSKEFKQTTPNNKSTHRASITKNKNNQK